MLDQDKCCQDPHVRSCVGVDVKPDAILREADITLMGSTLSFSNYMAPSGIVYKNANGEEAIFRYI